MLKEFEINLLKKIDESKPTLNTVRTIYKDKKQLFGMTISHIYLINI